MTLLATLLTMTVPDRQEAAHDRFFRKAEKRKPTKQKPCICGGDRSERGSPRKLVCVACWRHLPRFIRTAFNVSKRGSIQRREAIFAVFKYLKENPRV